MPETDGRHPLTVLAMIAVFSTGCVSHAPLSALPRDAIDESMDLVLMDGSETSGRALPLLDRAVEWRLDDGRTVEADAVQSATRVRHLRGALDGLGLGVGIGGGLGVLMGLASGDDGPCDSFCLRFSAEEKAVMSGLALGSMAGLVGTVIGAFVGHEDVYGIDPDGPEVTLSPTSGGGVLGLAGTF